MISAAISALVITSDTYQDLKSLEGHQFPGGNQCPSCPVPSPDRAALESTSAFGLLLAGSDCWLDRRRIVADDVIRAEVGDVRVEVVEDCPSDATPPDWPSDALLDFLASNSPRSGTSCLRTTVTTFLGPFGEFTESVFSSEGLKAPTICFRSCHNQRMLSTPHPGRWHHVDEDLELCHLSTNQIAGVQVDTVSDLHRDAKSWEDHVC